MATTWKVDGFAHGNATSGTGGVYDSVQGSPAIVTSPVRLGTHALHIPAAGAACRVAYTPDAGEQHVVESFYVRLSALPGAVVQLATLASVNGPGYFQYDPATGRFAVSIQNIGRTPVGPSSVAINTWYLVDLSFDAGVSPAVIRCRVDGGAPATVTRVQSPADVTSVSLGTQSAQTFDAFYADWEVSLTLADFPILDHHVESLILSSDGSHNIAVSGDFDSFTGTAFSNATTNGFSFIDHRPLQLANTADSVIRQDQGGVTDYMEFLFENLDAGLGSGEIEHQGVRTYASAIESGGGTSVAEVQLLLNDDTEVLTTGSLSVIDSTDDILASVNLLKRMAIAPSGGWTRAKVNGLKVHLGFGDAIPDVNFIDVMVEVAISDQTFATPATVIGQAAVPTPSVPRGVGPVPDSISAVAAVRTPTARGNANATPSKVSAAAAIATPTVVSGGAVSAQPITVVARASVRTPNITTGATSADFYAGGYGGGYETIEEVVEPPPEPTPSPREAAATPDLRVRVDWIHDLNITEVELPRPRWEDISALLRSPGGSSIRRGRQRSINKNEAGAVTLTFGDPDRILDPDNVNGPYWPYITTERRINVQAVVPDLSEAFEVGFSEVGGEDLVGGGDTSLYIDLIDAVIDNYSWGYPGPGKDAVVTIQAMDILAAMAKDEQQFQTHQNIEEIDDVLASILNERAYTGRVGTGLARSPYRDIPETGFNPIALAPMIMGNLKDALDMMAGSEGGNFFIARNGFPTYRERDWADRPADVKLRFTEEDIRYQDVEFGMDEQVIYNDITVNDFEGSAGAHVEDTASIRAHWRKPLVLNTAMNTDFQMEDRAYEVLFNYAEPRRFIRKLDLSNVIDDWALVLACDLWTKCLLEVILPNGDLVTQVSLVEGIELVTSNHRDWKLIWWLSVPPFRNILATDLEDVSFEGGTVGTWTMESAGNLSAISTEYTVYTQGHTGQQIVRYEPVNAPNGAFVLWADPTVNGDVAILSKVIEVEARQRYLARLKGRAVQWLGDVNHTPSTFSGSGRSRMLRVEMDWYDDQMELLSTDIGESVEEFYYQWSQAELSTRAPNGAAFMQVRVRSFDSGSFRAGQFIDAVLITRVV